MDTTSSTMAQDAMTPFFHFTSGDYLLFEAWKPSSAGAIAGACISLVCLALLDRWLFAARARLDYHWRRKGLALASRQLEQSTGPHSNGQLKKPLYAKGDGGGSNQSGPSHFAQRTGSTFARTIPPFIIAHDLPRGLIHAGQALLGYVLMLSVMTFNAAYIISIIAGLGIGETIFGRMGTGRVH